MEVSREKTNKQTIILLVIAIPGNSARVNNKIFNNTEVPKGNHSS